MCRFSQTSDYGMQVIQPSPSLTFCITAVLCVLCCICFGIVWRVSEIFKRREGERGRGSYLLANVVIIISPVLSFFILEGCPAIVSVAEGSRPFYFNSIFLPILNFLAGFFVLWTTFLSLSLSLFPHSESFHSLSVQPQE